MLNAIRTLTGVTLLALMLSGIMAVLSVLLVTPSHKAQVVVAWTTAWHRDDEPVQFRTALDTRDGEAPPILVGSAVYALGSDRQLHVLDAHKGSDVAINVGFGRRAFNFRISGSRIVAVVRSISLASAPAESDLVSVDTATRTVVWNQPLGADVFIDSLEVDADTVYVGVADNVDGALWHSLRSRGAAPSLRPRVRAYALSTGLLRWEQLLPERSDTGPADDLRLNLVGGQVLATEYGGGVSAGIVAVDPATGQIPWRDLTGIQALGAVLGQLLAGTGADVFLRAATSGRLIDRLQGPLPSKLASTLVSGTTLIWTGSDQVGAIDLGGGRAIWHPIQLGKPPRGATSTVMSRAGVVDGLIYIRGRDDEIYSIDLRTGTIASRFQVHPRTGPNPDYAPLRLDDLVLVQDVQLTAYRVP